MRGKPKYPTGMTRLEYVLQEGSFEARGFVFDILPIAPKQAGIDKTRATLATACIDESCEMLVEALKSYRREWDEKKFDVP